MPEFIIKALSDKNIIVNADKFAPNISDNVYEFYTDGALVGFVPFNENLLGVFEYKDAFQADFYDHQDWSDDLEDLADPEDDDQCLECQASALANTDTFLEAVLDIVDRWHEKSDDPSPEDDPFPSPPRVEQRLWHRTPYWGVTFDGRFAPFGTESSARNIGLANFDLSHDVWITEPIAYCPLVEEGL
jgi:hypothetical protein